MRWYSTSVRVWAGATVMESPVCTPMASKFSMEHTMMPLPARVAHDLHLVLFPAFDGSPPPAPRPPAKAQGPATRCRRSSSSCVRDAAAGAAHGEAGAQHHGVPERLGDGQRVFNASTRSRCGPFRCPARPCSSLNSLRSSPRLMASRSQPIISTPYLSSTPDSASSTAAFRPVWPPECGQQRVGLLVRDDLFHELGGDGLDVGAVGHGRVGHDGGGVAS